jgi:hypothetical protein
LAGLIWKEAWHDPKLRGWSSDEGWLWFHAISYTADHEKHGVVIPEGDLVFLAASHKIPHVTIAGLVERRGLDVVEGGYKVHNYKRRSHLSQIRSRAGRLGVEAKREANVKANSLSKTLSKSSGVEVGVVKELFETWKGVAAKPSARLTPKREHKLRQALQSYPADDVRDALLGWQNDPWPDRSLHNDPVILLRDGEQVEKFRDLKRNGRPAVALTNAASRGVAAGQDWADLAENLKGAGL